MDWKKITDTVSPYLEKAKVLWEKAVVFTENQIQMTPLFIKTQSEYEDLLTEKRVVLIAYDATSDIAKEIRLLSSVWLAKAFMDVSKLRYIDLTDSAEFARNIGFVWPLDMRVRFQWQETFHTTDLNEIKKWWQSPQYKKSNSVDIEEPASTDPLAGK